MANLIIKSSADNLVLQGSDASPAITVGTTGTTTFAENATFSGTANNLGTVTAATIATGVHGKYVLEEHDHFLETAQTQSNTASQDNINISGSQKITVTPAANTDIIEFSFFIAAWMGGTGNQYMGVGIQKSTTSDFSSGNSDAWLTGRHAWGWGSTNGSDDQYVTFGGTTTKTSSVWSLTADTTYYFRLVGQTHSVNAAQLYRWAVNQTNDTGSGVELTMRRWKAL